MRHASALALPLLASLALQACGPATGGSENPAAATIRFIQKYGFPKLSTLMPTLPPQLARIPGVATNASGLPELPKDVAGANFDDLGALLGAAQSMAAQGFSESRRLEASLLNLVAPAYDLLGRNDLFAGSGAPKTVSGDDAAFLAEGSGGVAASFTDRRGRNDLFAGSGAPKTVSGDDAAFLAEGSGGVASLFTDLLSSLKYAIDVGGEAGLPQYLVLGTDAEGSVEISGVWPDGGNFATGFAAKVRLESLEDFAVSITFAPGRLSGLIAGWDATKCPDDLWQLELGAEPAGKKRLAITSRECPATRNQVAQLALARTDASGAWSFTGAFAQSFPDADPQSLRGFLGKRQGFVMQAAATSDVSRVAGAAAVLGEADFAAPTQDKIDRFGVGQVLARFFQVRYFAPKKAKADDAGIFPVSEYDNVAYWMCNAPFVADAIQAEVGNVSQLCAGTELDVESILSGLQSALKEVKSAGLAPQSVEDELSNLIAVLSIRNTLFVGEGGALSFKKAPDQSFASLDDARKTALPPAVGNIGWLGGAQAVLPNLTQADIPDTAYKALAGSLGGFLKASCAALAGDSQAKAGKADGTASVCGG